MTEKIMYVANDGEEFETKEECEQYEHRFDKAKSIVFFDGEFKNLWEDENMEHKFENTYYMFISNAEEAKEFFHTFGYEIGMSVPDDELIISNTIVAYDEEDYGWYNLTDKIEKFSRAERKILGQIYA